MKNYQVDENGFYGEFGGAYIPEILHQCVEDLQKSYLKIMESDSFQREYKRLLKDYVGRPSPLYFAKRLSEKYGARIYLKREDLNHTGAHKINNTIGQILIARAMGKTRIIAETGAGQHGVATATAAADTPNFSSKCFTSSCKSKTDIFSITSTIDLNFAGVSTTVFVVSSMFIILI